MIGYFIAVRSLAVIEDFVVARSLPIVENLGATGDLDRITADFE